MAAGQLALTALMGALLVGIAAFLARMENWRTYTPLASGDGAAAAEHGHKPPADDTWRFVPVLRRGGAVAGRDRGVRAPVLHAGEEGGDTDEERPHENR